MVLDDERERHWRMVFKDKNGGVDRGRRPFYMLRSGMSTIRRRRRL